MPSVDNKPTAFTGAVFSPTASTPHGGRGGLGRGLGEEGKGRG
jgi:hypothetical protein